MMASTGAVGTLSPAHSAHARVYAAAEDDVFNKVQGSGSSLDGPLDGSLSADYLARRMQRRAATNGTQGSPAPPVQQSHQHQAPSLRASPNHSFVDGRASASAANGYANASFQPYGSGAASPAEVPLSNDMDYKLEALQLMLTSFKTKMRADFDSTFTTLERKARTQRKELLQHVSVSLEEAEARLGAAQRASLGDYQLLELEFRKNLKLDLHTLRNDMESEFRHSDELRTEMARKLKLQESTAQELRAKFEELLLGGGRGGMAGQVHMEQQLQAFQTALDTMQTKYSLELMSSRKDAELKMMELAHQLLDLRRVVESSLTQDEETQKAHVDFIRQQTGSAAVEIQSKVDDQIQHMHELLKNLYRNLELQSQNQDVLHAQLNELQSSEGSGAAQSPEQRKVTQAQLDSLEERLTNAAGKDGATGTALRALENSVDIQARKLDQLTFTTRELIEEQDHASRLAMDKFKKDLSLSVDSKLGTLVLDAEIAKRKLDLLSPELLTGEMHRRVEQTERDLGSRMSMMKDEYDRAFRAMQLESSTAREKQAALERRTEDLVGSLASLEAKLTAVLASTDARVAALASEAAARDKRHVLDLCELREKHAAEMQALRKELEESAATRERRMLDDLAKSHSKLLAASSEQHGQLAARIESVSSEQTRAVTQLERRLSEDIHSSVRRIDADVRSVTQALADVDAKTRRNEDTMRVAEELTRTAAAAAKSNAAAQEGTVAVQQAEWATLTSNVTALQLQQQLLTDKQETLLRTVTDSVSAQSVLQSSLHSFQRDVEKNQHASQQLELETKQQVQHATEDLRAELVAAVAGVDSRARQDVSELRLKLQDVEHSVRLAKKYGDSSLQSSPRRGAGGGGAGEPGTGSSVVEVAAGATLLPDSALRQLTTQMEDVDARSKKLVQQCFALHAAANAVSQRTDKLESGLLETRQQMQSRDLAVDEALRARVEQTAFDKFRRELHAQTQSQHHTVLSTAQAALAAANLAHYNASSAGNASGSAAPPTTAALPLASSVASRSTPTAAAGAAVTAPLASSARSSVAPPPPQHAHQDEFQSDDDEDLDL